MHFYSTVGLIMIVRKIIKAEPEPVFYFMLHMLAHIITKYVAYITHNAI